MTIEDLSARLEKVERANRWWKAGGGALLVLVAAVAAMGQASGPPKLIQAERFEVVDGTGQVLVSLGSIKTGDDDAKEATYVPSLCIHDGESGVMSAMLSVQSGGVPSLQLWGPEFSVSVGGLTLHKGLASPTKEDPAGISVTRQGWPVAVMSGAPDGSPSLVLSDAGGGRRAALGVISIERPPGKDQPRNTAPRDPPERTAASTLVLFDKDGKVLERLPK